MKNTIFVLLGIILYACGPNEQEIAEQKKKAEEERGKQRADSIAKVKAENPARFKKYLDKLQGTWSFEANNPCLPDGSSLCQKMKINIQGNTYKVFICDFDVKGDKLVRESKNLGEPDESLPLDYDLEKDKPSYEGKIELSEREYDIENKSNYLNLATIVCQYGDVVLTQFGGNDRGSMNTFYWDDEKEALYWSYSNSSKCQFKGYCQKAKNNS